MADIGEILREARMRARIDISDIESQTKIRAKYLRALENEEWDLLPGPTFVKSFLRTYAEALGLDARGIVDEYKLRHERIVDDPVQSIRPGGGAAQAGRSRQVTPTVPRPVLIVGLLALVVAALALVGSLLGGDEDGPQVTTTTAAAAPSPVPAGAVTPTTTASRQSTAKNVRVQIIPRGEVYVCLVAGSRVLVPGSVISEPTRTFSARRFRVNLGNSNVTLKINGRVRSVPRSDQAVGYAISRAGRTPLPPGQRPDCA